MISLQPSTERGREATAADLGVTITYSAKESPATWAGEGSGGRAFQSERLTPEAVIHR
jgi:hypothetical protein